MKKVFIDCGANKGQSIDLFVNSWDDAKEYEIHSFEANKDFLWHPGILIGYIPFVGDKFSDKYSLC